VDDWMVLIHDYVVKKQGQASPTNTCRSLLTQKFSIHCRHWAFVVVLQNFQAVQDVILLQVCSIRAP